MKLLNKPSFLTLLLILGIKTFSQDNFPLLDSSSLEYLGSFNVPNNSSSTGATFAWAGLGLAYNPHNNSLFMTGHDHYQLVGEMSIPEPIKSNDVTDLPIAELLQNFADITDGHIDELGVDGASISNANHNIKMGGLLVHGNNLYGSAYPYYEDATEADRSHFKSSLNISFSTDFQGMFKVGSIMPGVQSGYMTSIPEIWQDTLDATSLTGNACICIVSRSSYGPAISTFNPDFLELSNPLHSSALLYYPSEHPTLGDYDNETEAKPEYNMTTTVRGVVFPESTKTILFIGSTGLGIPEYGAGTDDITEDGTKVDGFDEYYVYDPASSLSKGPHAWPYTIYAWAYNVEDLLAVKAGTKEPWEVLPYDHWKINNPFPDTLSTTRLVGAAYDPISNRIFISQQRANRDRPVIHVFGINTSTPISSSKSINSNKKSGLKEIVFNKNICSFKTGSIIDGSYIFKVTSVNGKVLFTKQIDLKKDSNITIKSDSFIKNMSGKGFYIVEVLEPQQRITFRAKTLIY